MLGLALDGVGLGSDGSAWGGELLRVDGARFERVGHLAPLALPGGDAPRASPGAWPRRRWRARDAAAEIAARFADEPAAATVATLLARDLHAPPTTSVGRWFDAAAGLLGVRAHGVRGPGGDAARKAWPRAHGAVAPDSAGCSRSTPTASST